MSLVASKYIKFADVVNLWSDQSGELPLVTLRRISDWAICGRFPAGTFLLPNGEQIDHLDLHRAMRRELGEHAPITGDEAAKLFRNALVSKAGIQSFCEYLGVQPLPEMLSRGSKLLRLLAKPEHLGPPDCPAGASVASRLEARAFATAALRILEGLITQVKRRPDQAISEREIADWNRYANAQIDIEASDDPELRRHFDSLKREWMSLTTSKVIQEEAATAATQSGESIEHPIKRGIGRPAGSGTFEQEDLPLVEEIRADILSRKHTSISKAARERVPRAAGGGSEASKEKRLCTRYAALYPG